MMCMNWKVPVAASGKDVPNNKSFIYTEISLPAWAGSSNLHSPVMRKTLSGFILGNVTAPRILAAAEVDPYILTGVLVMANTEYPGAENIVLPPGPINPVTLPEESLAYAGINSTILTT